MLLSQKAVTMALLSGLRSFLTNNVLFAWGNFPAFLHHVFSHLNPFLALQRLRHAAMGRPIDGQQAKGGEQQRPKNRMVHLKTKEECRLGNETIQVWTVELPSKHAEGILKYHPSSPTAWTPRD